MTRRLPSPPPTLPGFTYISVLGSGGFADVFLYEQNFPRRQVAVKVMLSNLVNDQVRTMLQVEANVMAQLSGHPAILTVYQASVSADGRPYLVMELCSATLSQRYRNERLAVSEVLAIAIRVGSAVESAHRIGVLHRDIKPSNILTTAYGHPVLSDFGIASTLRESAEREAVGMSIPWSAPEVVMDETAGTVASEVWALAATVYSLLAARSPWEVVGKSNSAADLVSRINRAHLAPIGRADVPPSLEALLAAAMTRKPERRIPTILELLYGFQAVESELGLSQTPLEIVTSDWATATASDSEDQTRLRDYANRDYANGGVLTKRSATTRRLARRNVSGTPGIRSADFVSASRGVTPNSELRTRPHSARLLSWAVVVASILVVTLAATVTTIIVRSSSSAIPTVSDISTRIGATQIEFLWPDPGVSPDDAYQVSVDSDSVSVQTGTSFSVDAGPGDVVCLSVRVVRSGQLGEPSNPKCIEFTG